MEPLTFHVSDLQKTQGKWQAIVNGKRHAHAGAKLRHTALAHDF